MRSKMRYPASSAMVESAHEVIHTRDRSGPVLVSTSATATIASPATHALESAWISIQRLVPR